MSNPIPYYDEGDKLTEPEMAAKRRRSRRTLRDERKKGTASPYVKEGKTIIYSWRKYLEHLELNERRPVRSRRHHGASTTG